MALHRGLQVTTRRFAMRSALTVVSLLVFGCVPAASPLGV
jgi:hypothetical protein